jgi:hypothetical protein
MGQGIRGRNNMQKLMKLIIGFGFIIILASCNQKDPTNEINAHLEATVDIETSFEENQQHIFTLEKEDQEIYEEILALDADAYKEMVALSDKAIGLLDERAEYASQEKESMQASQTEFEKIQVLMDKVEDEKIKDMLHKLSDTMMERYEIYDRVFKEYTNSITLTKEHYRYFQEEHYSEKAMYETLEKVNNSYDEVTQLYKTFNDKTEEFNEQKKTYYDTITK